MNAIGACVVLGGDGHAHGLLECLSLGGWEVPLILLGNNRTQWGSCILGA